MLTVSSLAYTTKTMALNYALKTFTLRCTYYIYEACVLQIINSDNITQFVSRLKILELGQVSLGCYTGFLEVTHLRLSCVLLFLINETQLNSLIAIILQSLDLCNYTRTHFDNSAWKILSLGTENGCHSDFFS